MPTQEKASLMTCFLFYTDIQTDVFLFSERRGRRSLHYILSLLLTGGGFFIHITLSDCRPTQ